MRADARDGQMESEEGRKEEVKDIVFSLTPTLVCAVVTALV